VVNDIKSSNEFTVSYPYISKTFLLMFCGYVIIWYLQIGNRIPALGAIRFELIYATILIVIAFLFTPKIKTDCPLIPCVILYFLVIAIQVPFSYDFDHSWDVFVDRIIKFSFMAFFIVAFVRSPSHLKYFLGAFLLACFKMGQEGFIGRITGSLMWENQGVMRLHGVTDLYSHPNSFAGMALGVLPFVYSLWNVSNKVTKIFFVILSIFSINIIIFSGSRTGYVGLIVFWGIICYGYIKQNSNPMKILFIGISIGTLSFFFIPHDYVERFDTIFTLQEKEGHSSEKRIVIIKDAVQIFAEYPLGVGVAAFPKIRYDRFERSQDTHNLYLEVATNLGIQGVIIFAVLIYKLYCTLLNIKSKVILQQKQLNNLLNSNAISNAKLLQGQQHLADLKLFSATAVGVILFVSVRLALGLFGMDLYEIYWWFCIGLTIALFNIVNNSDIILNHFYSNN
jgi:putative inorganic carbon (hco3(-)) transporter